jgi:hypothetical protein
MKDCACAMIVSCALAKDFGAVVTYEGEPLESFESLLENTKAIVADATKVRPRNPAKQMSVAAPPSKKPWWHLW